MDAQTILWLEISFPLGFASAILTYFLLKKYQPVPKRKFVLGALLAIIVLTGTIGLTFLNEIVAVVFLSITLTSLAVFIWFMTQPFLKDSNARKAKRLKDYDEWKNKQRGKK